MARPGKNPERPATPRSPFGPGPRPGAGRPAGPAPKPVNPRAIDLLKRAALLLNGEQADLAIALVEDALKLAPNHPDGLLFMGRAYMLKQHWPEALRYLRRAAAKRPMHVDTLIGLAQSNDAINQSDKADNAMADLVRAHPSDPRVISQQVHRLQTSGRAEEAYAFVRERLDAGVTDPLVQSAHALVCRVTKRNAEGIDAARALIARPEADGASRRSALYVLGHMLDAEGDYDAAFDAFRRGNEMLEPQPAVGIDAVDLLWNEARRDATAVSPERTETPILVVGMPRSGTTITEQILAAHPLAETVGECDLMCRLWQRVVDRGGLGDADQMRNAGRSYLDRLGQVSRGGTTRVVDKMPENYFYLGFAERIVPGAHIVHCHRHPLDTCLSNYFQDFGDKVVWSRRLDVIAVQYRTYAYTMERMAELIETPILDWPNDRLVEDSEGQARKLLDHVGLPPDDRSLRFRGAGKSVRTASASQVREGVRKKKQARWKNYEKHIGPLIDELSDLVEAYEATYGEG